MLRPRLRASLTPLEAFKSLKISPLVSNSSHAPSKSSRILPFLTFLRSAHHASEGRANGPKDRPGRRLGAKRTGEQYVIPGNIIFRQRGTKWFPGENCDMGRDHTIYATEKGYVKYYKDPHKHPKRQYIGVAFDRNDVLPYPLNAPRKRRLGMVAVPMDETTGDSREIISDAESVNRLFSLDGSRILPQALAEGKKSPVTGKNASVGPRYLYRESNYEIGKAMEASAEKVRPYKKGDRWMAWQKRNERTARIAEMNAQKAQKKKKKKRAPPKQAA